MQKILILYNFFRTHTEKRAVEAGNMEQPNNIALEPTVAHSTKFITLERRKSQQRNVKATIIDLCEDSK